MIIMMGEFMYCKECKGSNYVPNFAESELWMRVSCRKVNFVKKKLRQASVKQNLEKMR